MTNPLQQHYSLPPFDQIEAKHALPALEAALMSARATLEDLCALKSVSWQNFAAIIEDIDEKIDRVWSPVSHLNSVKDSEELRDAYEAGIKLLTEYYVEVGQNETLYKHYKSLADSAEFVELSLAQQKIIRNTLIEFRLSGAELEAGDKKRFAEISTRLSALANQFERNVLDATQAWSKHFSSPDALEGLPTTALGLAKQSAAQQGLEGYLITLQFPSYIAVMQHARDRSLREEVYRAYSTRASDLSEHTEFDNAAVINEILRLKQEKALLLGYKNYAEVSLTRKMAASVDRVFEFLEELVNHAQPVAQTELLELTEFAQSTGLNEPLQAWDLSFYAERLREHLYTFTDEEVKAYFPASTVFSGMFEIVHRLFSVSIKPNAAIKTWHKDVQYFDINNAQGSTIGGFYADLYARQHKRGGAWMDTCIHRRKLNSGVQHPVAYLTCNFSPAIDGQPALLTHSEVETLFHEFGHTLHHLLTQVDERSVAGINGVEWDAVELPSQLLENWCWQTEGLELISSHYQTGATLPAELLERMRSSKNFHSGLQTLRQIEFALFDMRIHEQGIEQHTVQSHLDEVREQVAVLKPPSYNRFQNSFSHIFAGGYAAGYYSYKWAEVLSADVFEAFIEEGLFNPETGNRLLTTILEQGGVHDMNSLFNAFRGRDPEINALLQHTGILAAA